MAQLYIKPLGHQPMSDSFFILPFFYLPDPDNLPTSPSLGLHTHGVAVILSFFFCLYPPSANLPKGFISYLPCRLSCFFITLPLRSAQPEYIQNF
jgi:hypothetical protein